MDQFRSRKLLMVHLAPNSHKVVPQESTNPQDANADLILNMLLNIDLDCQRAIITKLVSHIDIHRSIEEVLLSIPIVFQATFNKTPVNWEDCAPPYAVYERAFQNHTHEKNKGLPHDPDPNVRTVGEPMATSHAKTKVKKSLISGGTLDQQQLILL